ncbi:hypothetical protein [Pedobacter sp.]|uniref:hypothetical protein n=1 Tax=Pedobacter sp. TaxID=1411316 RepID=UPI003563BBE1
MIHIGKLGLFRRKESLSGNRITGWIVFGMFFIFSVSIFINEINPEYLGLGYATTGPKLLLHQKGVVWLEDYYSRSAGGMGSSVNYRIRGIDLGSGKLLFTKLIGRSYELQGNGAKVAWLKSDNRLVATSLINGSTIDMFDRPRLGKLKGMETGVYKFDYNALTESIEVIAKDGHKTSFLVKHGSEKLANQLDMNLKVDANLIHTRDGVPIVSLHKQGEQQRLVFANKKTASELFLLAGRILAVDTLAGRFFTFSYKTLDRKEFIISCITMDGNLCWQVGQQQLGASDFIIPSPRLNASFFYNGKLVVLVEGFIFALEGNGGVLEWLKRV